MRIFVLANCQHVGLADSLRHLLPQAEIASVDIGAINGGPGYGDAELLERIGGYDLLLTQPLDAERFGVLRTDRLPDAIRACPVPAIAFDAYHPDACYLERDGRRLTGPMGDYHSRLVASAFVAGVPEDRVERLFNALTYARLGYLDRLPLARDFVLLKGREAGYDLTEPWADWTRDGPFMHTINHPAIRVLLGLTRLALGKAGIAFPEPAGLPVDHLARFQHWPIYPQVARRIPCEAGAFAFAVPDGEGGHHHLGLPEFIVHAYRLYRAEADFLPGCRALAHAIPQIASMTPQGAERRARRSTEDIVLALYRGVGQDPDAGGVAYWIDWFGQNGVERGIEHFLGNWRYVNGVNP